MRDDEKSRPGAATPERAETGNVGGLSPTKYIIEGGGVASLLLEGAENALPLKELERLTGQDGRTIRRQIETERRRGVPILSDNRNGYFLPACDYDRARFVGQMRGRAREIWQTANAVEQGSGEANQITFDDLNGEPLDDDDSPERYFHRIAPPGNGGRA
ncbi:MAG: helix-turn-helix domain-containing protein [Clostridiales bacterium]|nr:helix-turn-helix domain-containing protein [Clostridiales bacterium]